MVYWWKNIHISQWWELRFVVQNTKPSKNEDPWNRIFMTDVLNHSIIQFSEEPKPDDYIKHVHKLHSENLSAVTVLSQCCDGDVVQLCMYKNAWAMQHGYVTVWLCSGILVGVCTHVIE
jgi:hypothetical protein